MTELLPILAICVIMALTYIVCEVIKNKNNTETFTHPVTIKSETPSSGFTPHKGRVTGKIIGVKGDEVILYEKFSPPVYELEQWIRDNWKKIKVNGCDIEGWTVESEIYTGNLTITGIAFGNEGVVNTFTASNSGLSYEEVSYLKLIYERITFDREKKLIQIKEQRSRKQLARKLQQFGYGDGTYESK